MEGILLNYNNFDNIRLIRIIDLVMKYIGFKGLCSDLMYQPKRYFELSGWLSLNLSVVGNK